MAVDYTGLLAAAYTGDAGKVRRLIAGGAGPDTTQLRGRRPLHLAAYGSHEAVATELAEAGADLNALNAEEYDVVTIAAVADDPEFLRHALALGASPANVTSPDDGTVLIAAALR